MVGRDVVPRAALLVEPEPPLALLPEVVLPPHPDHRAHPRDTVEHDRDERAVAQAGERARVDRREEPAGLGRREHRRRARRDDVLGPPDGRRRVHRQDLADDEPVAEHADGRQVLLDGGRRPGVGPDVGRHVQRRDRLERQAARLAPGQKLPHGPSVRRPRPPVGDPRGEELQEPRHCHGPRVDDQPRQREPLARRRARRPPGVRRRDPHQVVAHSRTSPPPPAASPASTSASNCS